MLKLPFSHRKYFFKKVSYTFFPTEKKEAGFVIVMAQCNGSKVKTVATIYSVIFIRCTYVLFLYADCSSLKIYTKLISLFYFLQFV